MTKTIPLFDAAGLARQRFQQTLHEIGLTHPEELPSLLLDRRQRPLRDLRISVTDRCNFRCTYCMPKDAFGRDHAFLSHDEVLRFEEITRLAQLFARLGVRKIRLTGGEPLLRKNIERLIEMLAAIDGIDLTLTTNASILAKKAQSLRDAGLQRVTVSLDAIDDATFRKMNDVNFPLARVLEGIDAAARAGLTPVKINTVVKRGVNEKAILPLIRHFKGSGHIVRFIEFMDVGATNGWRMNDVVSAAEIVETVHAEFPLGTVESNYHGEVAERWRFKDGSGEIGVIASVTQAFCRDCTRMRLSTNGQLFSCLFADHGYDIRALLRAGAGDDELIRAIAALWQSRDDNYSEQRTAHTPRSKKIEMSYIGG